jgi:anti-anti-sigma factor
VPAALPASAHLSYDRGDAAQPCDPPAGAGGTREDRRRAPEGPAAPPVRIHVGPALTAAAAADLRDVLSAAVDAAPVVALRLDAVVSFDGVGLGLLLRMHRRAQRRGARLVVVNAPPRLRRALHGLKLHRVLVLADEPPDVEDMEGGPGSAPVAAHAQSVDARPLQ